MGRLWRTALRAVHVFGFAAFAGSVFAVVALAQLNDGSGDWARIHAARADVATIVRWVTYPGLAFALLSGLALLRARPVGAHRGRVRMKAGLAVLLAVNTYLVVGPAAMRLRDLSAEAGRSPEAASRFRSVHLREDVSGAVNLLVLLGIAGIGLTLGRGRGPEPREARPKLPRRAGG